MEITVDNELQHNGPFYRRLSTSSASQIPAAAQEGEDAAPEERSSDEDSPDEVMPTRGSRRRSSRVKVRPLELEQSRTIGPKKLNARSSAKDIEKYYLDKKVKRVNPTLETIFEEPHEEALMSTRKFKRFINFSVTSAKNNPKVKKRKLKAKGISAKKRNGKKVTMKLLMDKLAELDE